MNEATEEMTGRLVTIAEACELLGLGRSSVYKLLDNRRLRSVKIGSARRIWTRDIEAFMSSLLSDQNQIMADIDQLAYKGAVKGPEPDNSLQDEESFDG